MAVSQVQGTYSSLMPVWGNIVLGKLDGAFEMGSPVAAFRDELDRSIHVVESVRITFYFDQFRFVCHFLDNMRFNDICRQVTFRIAEIFRVVYTYIIICGILQLVLQCFVLEQSSIRLEQWKVGTSFCNKVLVIQLQVFRDKPSLEQNRSEQRIDDCRIPQGCPRADDGRRVTYPIYPILCLRR